MPWFFESWTSKTLQNYFEVPVVVAHRLQILNNVHLPGKNVAFMTDSFDLQIKLEETQGDGISPCANGP